MLYNSDGLPVICMVYQKVYIFYVIFGTFYQYIPYFQNKIKNRKNLQYENNLRFQKVFFQNDLEKGGYLNLGPLIF